MAVSQPILSDTDQTLLVTEGGTETGWGKGSRGLWDRLDVSGGCKNVGDAPNTDASLALQSKG